MLRIIPKIEIKNNFLVKGIHLEGLRVIGEAQISPNTILMSVQMS